MGLQLAELKAPPVDVKDALTGALDVNPTGGVLGATLGESPAEAAARIEEAKKNATDLTGLIRKKPKPDATTFELPLSTNGTNGKRKAEDDPEESDSKKVKVNELPLNGSQDTTIIKQPRVEDAADE